jgi:hypothetical protein
MYLRYTDGISLDSGEGRKQYHWEVTYEGNSVHIFTILMCGFERQRKGPNHRKEGFRNC